MKCIIEKVIPKKITGRRSYLKPAYYRNTETGDEYSYLAGGIGWPFGDMPGYCCAIGVGKTSDGSPTFRVLDELENRTAKGLLEGSLELRQRWGYEKFSELFRYFYGNYERFWPVISAFNDKLNRNSENQSGLYFSPPSGFDMNNHLQIYIQVIRELLTRDKEGEKRLFIGDCSILRNRIASIQQVEVDIGDINRCPAIFALGGVLHSIIE
jgi:hypothetical protein